MKFTPKFYYCAMTANIILRFWWLIGIFTIQFTGLLDSFALLTFLGGMAEAIRRTLWSILRVENEFFNNFEQYRDIIIIPPIKQDDELAVNDD